MNINFSRIGKSIVCKTLITSGFAFTFAALWDRYAHFRLSLIRNLPRRIVHLPPVYIN